MLEEEGHHWQNGSGVFMNRTAVEIERNLFYLFMLGGEYFLTDVARSNFVSSLTKINLIKSKWQFQKNVE